jgi:superoxide reductase
MTDMKDLFQTADWKQEKHVPVLQAPAKVKKGEAVNVTVTVGKEIPHPNTTAHHISWISVLFHPAGEKFPIEIGRTEFSAHGASATGADTSTVYTQYETHLSFKTEKPGTLVASSYCNIHGLWQGSHSIEVG